MEKQQKDESKQEKPQSSMSEAKSQESSGSDDEVEKIVLWSSDSSSGNDDKELTEMASSLLNFTSTSFSPPLALKCKTSDIPMLEGKGAIKYLNIQQYSKAINSPSKTPRKDVPLLGMPKAKVEVGSKKSSAGPSEATSSSSSTPHYPIPGRRFLPHQLPVYRPRQEHPNTITLMKTVKGPLSVLNRVMIENIRVKIWTRNDLGFRGYLTGFVDCFDKHWNIGLRDVDEQFIRRKQIKFPVIGNISDGSKDEPQKDNPFGGNGDGKDSSKRKDATFIRLQNYLRQNRVKKCFATDSLNKQTDEVGRNRRQSRFSTGSEAIQQEEKISFGKSLSKTRKTVPDLLECHKISRDGGKDDATSSSSRKRPPSLSKKSTESHHHHPVITQQQLPPSSTSPFPSRITNLLQKNLTVLKKPFEDNFGFMVVAHSKKYELVERHVAQMVLMGSDIIFIESSNSGSS